MTTPSAADDKAALPALAQAILDIRFYRHWSLFLAIVAIMSTAATYLIFIYPVFLAPAIDNPAVLKFIGSREYRAMSRPSFDELIAFNRAADARAEPPNGFMALDPSQFGLLVRVHYKPVPNDAAAAPGSPVRQYKFVPDILVRPDVPVLIVFVGLELSLVLGLGFLFLRKRPAAELSFEEQALNDYFLAAETAPSDAAAVKLATLVTLLGNFHQFCLQINRRGRRRPGIAVADEYDVQDILHALLKLHFDDVRSEEYGPSHAGANSRIDFLLHGEQIVVEVKMTRNDLKDDKLGEELIVDIERYARHPKCKFLICFVYDPRHLIENPAGLKKDIDRRQGQFTVQMIVAPKV